MGRNGRKGEGQELLRGEREKREREGRGKISRKERKHDPSPGLTGDSLKLCKLANHLNCLRFLCYLLWRFSLIFLDRVF